MHIERSVTYGPFIIAIKPASTRFNFVGSNQDSSHTHDSHTQL